jgi:PhnB protein
MEVQAYLNFEGRCEEALEFYRETIGAEILRLMRYKEAPELPAPGIENKIMHSTFRVGETTLMASDGHAKGNPRFEGFSLSISAADAAEAERIFNALAVGGEVRLPLTKTFFSSKFGILADKFGVGWMVIANGPVS